MENSYIKQFPDVMRGKKVLYVHGFGSSGQSGTVTLIRQSLPEATVIAPDLPIHPEEAMQLLAALCRQEEPDLIIGTSMGGMYAEMLRGYDRILVNPAFEMGETMRLHGMTGAQHFSNPRQDGVQEFIVTKALVKEYKNVTEQCFGSVTPEECDRVWGLFGDEDTTVDTIGLFSRHYPRAIRFHGEHRMNDRSFMHSVMPVIRWIDDRQEGHQRPIIYVAMSAMSDKWHKPFSSLQKTLRSLLERYELFFVDKASYRAEAYAATLEWLYEYVNVPAFGHTVFTNQKHLLYGDYLIDTEKTAGMATLIEYGSDTFKTWDDVSEYFDRLCGQ